jgi:hypothetical protein
MTIRPSRSIDSLIIVRQASPRIKVAGALLVLAFVSACFAAQTSIVSAAPQPSMPGFWRGFWHGFIAPIAFIASLFSDTIRIYALPNAGLWYDFGFMLGIGGFSGGIFAGSKPRGGRRSRDTRNGKG